MYVLVHRYDRSFYVWYKVDYSNWFIYNKIYIGRCHRKEKNFRIIASSHISQEIGPLFPPIPQNLSARLFQVPEVEGNIQLIPAL